MFPKPPHPEKEDQTNTLLFEDDMLGHQKVFSEGVSHSALTPLLSTLMKKNLIPRWLGFVRGQCRSVLSLQCLRSCAGPGVKQTKELDLGSSRGLHVNATTPVHDSGGLPKALGLTRNFPQDLITKSCSKQLRKYVFCFAAVAGKPFNLPACL